MMNTLQAPDWDALLDTPRTRWFTDPDASWDGVWRCDLCGQPTAAILTWQVDVLDADGATTDTEERISTTCGGCLPDMLPHLTPLSDPLAEGTVIEVEVDAAWLRLTDTPAHVGERFGGYSLGCGA